MAESTFFFFMTNPTAEIPHSKLCTNVSGITVHQSSPTRRLLLISLAVLAYGLVLPSVLSTMGKPLERAMEQAARLEQNRSIQLEQEFLAQAHEESVVAWDDDDDSEGQSEDTTVSSDDDDEINKEQATVVASKEADKNATSSEERPLPSAYLPDALPMFLLFLVITGTGLHFLMCRWFVWWQVWTEYEPVTGNELGENLFVHVIPLPHRGKPSLCPVMKNKTTGEMEFVFQRQTYVWVRPQDFSSDQVERLLVLGESANDDASFGNQLVDAPQSNTTSEFCMSLANTKGFIRLMLAKTNEPISFYLKSEGIPDESTLQLVRSRFGFNTLAVPQPPFLELLKAQLLMPLSVFQVFSALLWAIDEYLQYTLFTLFSIALMESTTAFQRHRTMKQLKGLSPKSYSVFVKRQGSWTRVPTEELLPGDLISLRIVESEEEQEGTSSQQGNQKPTHQETIIPCDLLILSGSAIVNEATLTGESIPQMKDALAEKDTDRNLDVDGADRIHTLFSGTSLVAFSPSTTQTTPDGGFLCRVLRTGFGSSQGELMQMIEFSSQAVSADSKETGAALLILLVFALISAAYVFQKGLEKGDRTEHELLLKCIIIVTSVVPRQLPVQMALAVNHALMALLNEGIYCTEPYRVPEAGKVTHALFDKTGTLTADELTPIGVTSEDGSKLVSMREANPEATLVLACCHALVAIQEGTLAGDPIEVAAVRGVRWGFDATRNRAFPGDTGMLQQTLVQVRGKILASQQAGEEKNKAVIANLRKEEADLVKAVTLLATEAKNNKFKECFILRRFHFESALQRMSVLISANDGMDHYALCKGSPEALKELCEQVPEWYNDTYQDLAERGMRVLALGMKKISAKTATDVNVKRTDVEKDLEFVGFVAFEAKIRGDSGSVIKSLKYSKISVSMLTGDAPLTALHVAKCCGFLRHERTLKLQVDKESNQSRWVTALQSSKEQESLPVNVDSRDCGLGELAEQYNLICTEEGIEWLSQASEGRVWYGVGRIIVFSRMSPRGKAKIIRAIQKLNLQEDHDQKFVLMCGDGGNDVGALKQADVGLALLSGYGSANTGDGSSADEAGPNAAGEQGAVVDAENELNEQLMTQKKRAAHYQKLKNQELEVKKAELMRLQRIWMDEEIAKLSEAEKGFWGHLNAMKTASTKMTRELQKEAALLDKKYNLAAANDSKKGQSDDDPFAALDDPNGGGLPSIRPGDASVAAPFTSRVPSVRSVVHLVRQGRCTLLSSLQQQQIMMLECTITAYTYAAISLEGARSSERQMMVSSWLIMAASLSFSYSTPIDRMHPVKPLRSLFHPAVFLSIFGQAVIHLYSMSNAVKMATDSMGPDKIQEVVDFNKKVSAGMDVANPDEEEDPLQMLTALWHKPFLPNLMNTTVFLVETAQIMAVLFVNYKGRPFMKGMLENHALFLSLFICIGGIAFASWEVLPEFNRALHFYPFPNDEYRWNVMFQISLVVLGTLVWDRLMIFMFARPIFDAMVDEARKTHFPQDLIPILTSLGKTVAGFLVFSTGNPIIWFGSWWGYRKYKTYQEEQEAKALFQ